MSGQTPAPRRLQVGAHRGASGTRPENTLAAFRRALELGCDWIELDVHLSHDDVPVVIHDFTVDRTTDGTGRVRDLTVDELQRLDAGSWFDPAFRGEHVPTLAEVLDLVADRAMLTVEIKSGPIHYPNIVPRVLEVIRTRGDVARVTIASFDHTAVRAAREIEPAVGGAILFVARPVDVTLDATAAKADALHPNWAYVTPEVVRQAHARRLAVRVWTVDDPATARALADMGVDAIFTNAPERLLQVLEAPTHERHGPEV
ncbi:MAG TPA: glycerophosphodiester phosphodiesterase [Chloroflexota bacterium]